MINRFSSRRVCLKRNFLAEKLKNAKVYKRIAGYFRSSIFELIGEEISKIPRVQVVCNSDLDVADIISVNREKIKEAVKKREIRLVVATDAASEGLNLQTLGTLINIDLPWNPSRLEQRLGRIKRIGQVRQNVDMLNLVYKNTIDEKIYNVLSKRMKDRYDIFGSVPDTIEDDWIEDIEKLEEMIDKYMHLRNKTKDAFSIRYEEEIDPDKNRWELWEKVVSKHEVIKKLGKPWQKN
jgi:SNF2 family DNA or RNA helicase